jgi:WXG100 family type VII secretion target
VAQGTIHVDYEQLEKVTQRFQQQAEACKEMVRRLQQRVDALENGGWEGGASRAFFNEMNGGVLPALGRLDTALQESGQAARQVAQIFRQAEEDTRNGFAVDGASAAPSGVAGFVPVGGTAGGAAIPAGTTTYQVSAAVTGAVVEGEIETEGIAVPVGTFATGDVNKAANDILQYPKESLEEFQLRFGEPGPPELLRQLAGWAENAQNDPRPGQAYEAALKMHLRLFDKFDESLKRRFIDAVSNLDGPGADRLKADTVSHLLQKSDGWLSGATQMEYARGLTHLMNGADSEKMLDYMITHPEHEKNVQKMFTTAMANWPHGQRSVGQLIGRSAMAVASEAASGDPAHAQRMANRLGRIVANAELSLYDLQKYRKSTGGPSTEHGAAIVRGSLSAIELLTGGISTPVTGPLKKGVDILEEYEKGNAPKEAPDPRVALRESLSDMVQAAYYSQLDPTGTKSGSPRIQDQVEDFRANVFKGRDETWREVDLRQRTPPGAK